MNKKLTLSLDRQSIDQAKVYAKDRNTSLSILVESFFKSMIREKPQSKLISPMTLELLGVLKKTKVKNLKKEYADYLEKKYQ